MQNNPTLVYVGTYTGPKSKGIYLFRLQTENLEVSQNITLVPLGQESGLTTIRAASLMSFMGGGAIGGAMLLAFVADKIDRVFLLTVLLLWGGGFRPMVGWGSLWQFCPPPACWRFAGDGGWWRAYPRLLGQRFALSVPSGRCDHPVL